MLWFCGQCPSPWEEMARVMDLGVLNFWATTFCDEAAPTCMMKERGREPVSLAAVRIFV